MLTHERRLIIVGAGDFAREVLWACSDIPAEQRDWVPGGFLDDNPKEAGARLEKNGVGLPVLGTTRGYEPKPKDVFVCAIGAPRPKLEICEGLAARGARFINVIHPTAGVAPNAKIGAGCIIWRYATVSVDVQIGDHVIVNCYSSAGHDAVLESGCTLSSHCDITGHAHLARGVFLGTHAAVLPGVKVGEFAVIGAGSVVYHRVQPGHTVVGVPARVMF